MVDYAQIKVGVHETYSSKSMRTSQVFISNPRSLTSSISVKGFQPEQPDSNVFIHTSLLTHPASKKENVRALSTKHIIACLKAADSLKMRGVVTHPGSGESDHLYAALEKIRAFREQSGNTVPLLIENDTGAGAKLGSLSLIKECHERFGTLLCLDTAHLYASKREREAAFIYHPESVLKVYGHMLTCIHLNNPDTIVGYMSGLDRHSTPIEEGAIEVYTLKLWAETFVGIPMILEHPDLNDYNLISDWLECYLEEQENEG